ncbi:hypothetical protein CYMTET_35341 [Cymbomonas tetramitiformis]|uniref:Methylenetetrahydrofolate reductase (NAD(P)H) n=1 Tax=Cymbomonas tetramitiformis TaxID=36881 RepID=A0AAE0F9B1_9CHLO|nr:hypothetical protein CYMTET_35341 [Cymbomonas tetramitiformis]
MLRGCVLILLACQASSSQRSNYTSRDREKVLNRERLSMHVPGTASSRRALHALLHTARISSTTTSIQRGAELAGRGQDAGIWGGEIAPRATLEVPSRGRPAAVSALLQGGVFGALVHSDLPDPGRFSRNTPPTLGLLPDGVALPEVSTTAACRWGAPTGDLARRLRERTMAGDRARLLVGGNNELWRNPVPRRFVPDVLELLSEAQKVRRQLALEGASTPALWCAVNPLAEDPGLEAARLAAKVAGGAEVVVTQPIGLLGERADRFWAAAAREGVVVPILAGVRVPSGLKAVEQWLQECGVDMGASDVTALLKGWRTAETEGGEAFARFRQAQLAEAINLTKSFLQVVGIHVSPSDVGGISDLAAFINDRQREFPDEAPL